MPHLPGQVSDVIDNSPALNGKSLTGNVVVVKSAFTKDVDPHGPRKKEEESRRNVEFWKWDLTCREVTFRVLFLDLYIKAKQELITGLHITANTFVEAKPV